MYHDPTLKLLNQNLQACEKCQRELQSLSQRLAIELPESFVEWYMNAWALNIMYDHSNSDRPISLAEMELVQVDDKKLLTNRWETQGVCLWAVSIDGSANPPVYVNVEEAGWVIYSSSFSDYVFAFVWDWYSTGKRPFQATTTVDRISSHVLEILQKKFRQLLVTQNWPGDIQYRFESELGRVLIWCHGEESDWFIAAEELHAFRSLLESVAPLDQNLASTLFSVTGEEVEAVLSAYRRQSDNV